MMVGSGGVLVRALRGLDGRKPNGVTGSSSSSRRRQWQHAAAACSMQQQQGVAQGQ
jgi:hypothetical protein